MNWQWQTAREQNRTPRVTFLLLLLFPRSCRNLISSSEAIRRSLRSNPFSDLGWSILAGASDPEASKKIVPDSDIIQWIYIVNWYACIIIGSSLAAGWHTRLLLPWMDGGYCRFCLWNWLLFACSSSIYLSISLLVLMRLDRSSESRADEL